VKIVQFSEQPERFFPIHGNRDTFEILIMTTKQEAWLYNPKQNCAARTQLDGKDVLWPYRIVKPNESEFHWSFWDESAKKIRFTHSDSFEVALDEMPFISMSSSGYWLLCFICVTLRQYLRKDSGCFSRCL